LLLLLSDVDGAQQIEENLLRSEKLAALDNIIAGVAHELNNPLTAILGYTELLLAGELTPPLRRRLAAISEEAERCRKVVNNLHKFSQQDKKPKTREDLNGLVKETLGMMLYQMGVDGIEVETLYDPALPHASVNVPDLQRAILNIVTNAHQALSALAAGPKRLLVETRHEADRALLTFADNGPGIPEDVRSRIFDPFFTTRNFGDGMGLGLSVAYGIVKEHLGEILVDSTEGEGAKFTIRLPLLTDDSNHDAEPE